jgi:hypothetical protein
MKLDYAHFNKFNPLPGSELYRQLVGQGYKFDFSKSSTLDHSEVLYMNPGMDKEKFSEYLDKANKRFYLRPNYILHRLISIRSFYQLKGQMNGFFAIFNI